MVALVRHPAQGLWNMEFPRPWHIWHKGGICMSKWQLLRLLGWPGTSGIWWIWGISPTSWTCKILECNAVALVIEMTTLVTLITFSWPHWTPNCAVLSVQQLQILQVWKLFSTNWYFWSCTSCFQQQPIILATSSASSTVPGLSVGKRCPRTHAMIIATQQVDLTQRQASYAWTSPLLHNIIVEIYS